MSDDTTPPHLQGPAVIRFSQLAADAMVDAFKADVKARLDAQGADAFDLAAKEVEQYGEFLLVAVPGMAGRQMMMRLASRLREVAKDLRRP